MSRLFKKFRPQRLLISIGPPTSCAVHKINGFAFFYRYGFLPENTSSSSSTFPLSVSLWGARSHAGAQTLAEPDRSESGDSEREVPEREAQRSESDEERAREVVFQLWLLSLRLQAGKLNLFTSPSMGSILRVPSYPSVASPRVYAELRKIYLEERIKVDRRTKAVFERLGFETLVERIGSRLYINLNFGGSNFCLSFMIQLRWIILINFTHVSSYSV